MFYGEQSFTESKPSVIANGFFVYVVESEKTRKQTKNHIDHATAQEHAHLRWLIMICIWFGNKILRELQQVNRLKAQKKQIKQGVLSPLGSLKFISYEIKKKSHLRKSVVLYLYQSFPCLSESQILQAALGLSFGRKLKSWKIPRGRKAQWVFWLLQEKYLWTRIPGFDSWFYQKLAKDTSSSDVSTAE